MTDNAFVHYREGKAIHHVDASACVYVCVRVQYARGLIICRWRGSPQGFSVVVEGDGGGAGGLAGRCNAGKASGDKDSHWCQAGVGCLFGWGSWE